MRESQAMAQEPRARVFVLFLDVNHVEIEASRRIRQPLIDALDKMIGPDDLVAVMTPEMSARDITFARKTTTIDGLLSRYWYWGERDRLAAVDPQQDAYRACYPGRLPDACPDGSADDDRGVADEMIARRQEKQTLDALEDLVGYLRGVREERKAVIAITDGWLLYRPNPNLSRELHCRLPGAGVSIDPRSGKLSTKPPDNADGSNDANCERDRMTLARIDDADQYRRLLDAANRCEHLVLSRGSARSRRVRHADRHPSDGAAAARGHHRHAAERRRRDAQLASDLAAHARRIDRWPRDRRLATTSPAAFSGSCRICRRTTCSATTRPASWMGRSTR